jgi:membrane protein DedA with SNARE-associated domain
MISKFITNIVAWYVANMTYSTITLLMFIESTFIPLPSELIIPPAVFNGTLNVFLIVIFATIGAVLGSTFNYFLSYFLGRKILYSFADSKIGHLMFLSSAKLEKAETYFNRHGNSSTFVGRLVPGIRHLISIPAGLAKMNFKNFILYTAMGSFIWHSVLAAISYFLYINNITYLFEKYDKQISNLLIGLGILFVIYLIIRYFKKKD